MNFFEDKNKNTQFMLDNMMGPNAVLLLEELLGKIKLNKDMRILDLGCGKGLTSLALAKLTGAQIFAADLWITPTENYERFKEMGFENQIIPLSVDASKPLPFADNYFDAVISVDSYHYFGSGQDYLQTHILPLLKPGGIVGIAIPGLQKNFDNGVPSEMQPYWQDDMFFYSVQWWNELWQKAKGAEVKEAFSLKTHAEAWQDWLKSSNPYAVRDVDMMKAEGGKYFDTIGIIAQKK
ncbi:cyclopropane fatty-acyl-phospholipid synthase-like methyltransferase [Elusimicrobium simillimum]|uniref:SAM-dependent methyltransferase n=1 Tax=Elusimicrobium simillimum TaxID=3143438 RepID=UPI003C700E31